MKEIKAFVHRNRVADVIHALERAGFTDFAVADVKGMLRALDLKEQEYSLEIGEKVITEVKIELVCAADRADEAVRVILDNARTGQATAGWVYVLPVEAVHRIGA